MKLFKKFVSILLVIVLLAQPSLTAFAAETEQIIAQAEDGVTYQYNRDGSITATILVPDSAKTIEKLDADIRLMDAGNQFSGTSEDLHIELDKVHTQGEPLVSMGTSDGGISFFPEAVAVSADKTAPGAEDEEKSEEPDITELPMQSPAPAPEDEAAEEPPLDELEGSLPPIPEVAQGTDELESNAEQAALAEPVATDIVVNDNDSPADISLGGVSAPEAGSDADAESIEQPAPSQSSSVSQPKKHETEESGDGTAKPVSAMVYDQVTGLGQGYANGSYGSVFYPGAINEYTDVEIISQARGVKENIIMRAYTTTVISYILNLDGLTPVISGSTILLVNRDNETVGEIAAPYMYDAIGSYSSDIGVSLESISGGQYRLSYSMDGDWLESASYPVVLDPSVRFSGGDSDPWSWLEDNYVSPQSPGTRYDYRNTINYVGNKGGQEFIMYVRPVFPNSLVKIADNVIITDAKLYTYVSRMSGGGSYSMYQVIGDWHSKTITYNNAPAYLPVASQSKSINGTGRQVWDLKPIASTWFNTLSQLQEYGVVIRADDPYYDNYLQVESSDSFSNPMYYTITYYTNPSNTNVQMNALGNGANSGTGYIDLSWNAVSGAEGYYVGIFNGKEFEYIDAGNVTSWSSRGKGIWPTEAEISAGRYQLHTMGGGAELPMLPAFTYANANGGYESNLNYYVRVIPVNSYGQAPNPENHSLAFVRLPDTLAPSIASRVYVNPSTYTNSNSLTLYWNDILDYNDSSTAATLSMGDNGHIQYSIDSYYDWKNTNSAFGNGSYTIDTSGLKDGTHYVYIRGVDSAGNQGVGAYAYFYIDRTAPTAPKLSLVPEDWTNINKVSLTWSGISDTNELSRVEYSIDGSSVINSTGIRDKEYLGYALDISSLSPGIHTLSVRGVDIAGNPGAFSSIQIKKDDLAPTVSSTDIVPTDWTNGDEASISWAELADEHSGLELAWYSIDGGETVIMDAVESHTETLDISGLTDGEHDLLLHFEDVVGNALEKRGKIYRDVTPPALTLLSPVDGAAVNGAVELWGSVKDISLDRWQVVAIGADGVERVIASGDTETNAELMAILACSAYDDGERVELRIDAIDKAGNTSSVSGAIVIVDKSAKPVSSTVEITSPENRESITLPSVKGSYTLGYSGEEKTGLLYIDGVYAGETKKRGFAFDAITYPENSAHSISILSQDEDGTVHFSGGLTEYIALSDAFENTDYLSSHEGITLGNSARADSDGELISTLVAPIGKVLALRIEVTEDSGESADYAYYYTIDGGSTWEPISPGAYVPVLEPINSVQIKAELPGGAVLRGWNLYLVLEASPLSVSVNMLRHADSFTLDGGKLPEAAGELYEPAEDTRDLYLYRDGVLSGESFVYDALTTEEDSTHQTALLAETESGTVYGTGAAASLLLRENVNAAGTVQSEALSAGKPIYALRLEVLAEGKGKYYYSADSEAWTELTPGQYAFLPEVAETVYLRANMSEAELRAWHLEAVTASETSFTTDLVQEPEQVSASDWGQYYENEKLWRYDLSWTDPTPEDTTAHYVTEYEIYRNGVLIGKTESTTYTDTDYIADARYAVCTVRNYGGVEMASNRVNAFLTVIEAPERIEGVQYTPEEQKQSEYLDSLYGGNYTFSDENKAPKDDRQLDKSVLGRNKLCANGFEPINFNTGNFLLEARDGYWTDQGLAVVDLFRTYNTLSDAENGPFGAKWSSPWMEHLRLYTGGDIVYTTADGAEIVFTREANGSYSGGTVEGLTLAADSAANEYVLSSIEGTASVFTGAGLLKEIRWSDGSAITVVRDEDGLMIGLGLPSGRSLAIETDENGHITGIETLGGSMLKYEYQGNDLVRFTDAEGNTTRYVYDGKGRMTEWYDAEGNRQVKNTYDNDNRVIEQLDALGGKYSLEYFADHTVTTDAEGNVSEIWFDELKHTTKTVDANGGIVLYEYDAAGQIAAITNETGGVTRYEYDDKGHVTKQTAPDGSVQKFAYDESGNLVSATDALENTTLYEYNEANLRVKEIAPDGGVTTYAYNENGQTVAITDALGNVTRFEYKDALLVKSTDANGGETRYGYDAEGRLISTTDALGNTTRFTYDNADNLTAVTFADGTEISYTYDAVGNILTQTDALGNVTAFEYDALSQLVRTVYADGTETRSEYDLSGNVISSTDANGNTVTAGYDGMGNLLSATDPMGNTVSNAYDAAGRLLRETMPNGGTAKYHYDINGKLSSVETATGEVTHYAYDPAGNLSSVTSPDGGTVSFTYDSMGRLLTETDASGAVTAYTYDAAGRVSTRTDALGNVTSYTFDAVGNLLSVTDALGGVTAYEYDALGRMISVTDANGATTTYEYNAVGALIRETDALGNATEYSYDANGSITGLTDALGGKTALSYDELGQVTDILQKGGGTLSTEYDAAGNLLRSTDALGNATGYEYNANGLVTRITDALEQSAEISYDALGNVSEITSPDGGKTAYTYDLSGRLLSETDALGTKTGYAYDKSGRLSKTTVNGNETAYEYDLRGNITAVTDAEGRRIELKYDALGNMTALVYPDGSKDAYEYDALSRLIKYTPRSSEAVSYTYNAMGDVLTVTQGKNTTAYEYDLLGRRTAIIDAAGARTETVYDELGHVISETDALGNSTLYSYTAAELLETVEFANGGKWRMGYDLVGNLLTETDPDGGKTAYEYDPVGRISAVTDALGGTTRYEYDAADNLTALIDARGNTTRYEYDLAGNLLSETDALGNTVSYTYTPEGWLKTATDAEGNVTRYTYDATGNVLTEDYAGQQHAENSYNEIGLLTTVTTEAGETKYQYDEAGRLISVTQPGGETVSYTYDGRGNRTSLTYPDGRTVKYTYDDLNRLVKVKGLDGDTTKYSYDELGRRVKTDGSKEDTVYAYDEVGNLISQTTTGAYELALEYAYDKSGRMTDESRTENGATVESRYVYDALGQLTSFTRSDGYEESYAYDPAGNMTAKTVDGVKTNYSYNAANQLVSDGENRYTYDKNGNLVQKGNTRYTYNALNRLESYTGADGYSESYTYNTDGLLSTVTNDNGTTSFVWDILYGDGVVLTTETNGETTAYDYGLERISAITGKYKTEYVHDALGNVAAEVGYNSAWYTLSGLLAKNSAAAKEYTPFGELLTEDVSGFGYRGEYYSADTGAVYLRARFYEPELNRFNQKDILRGDISVPVSLNRYAYVRNDPVNFIDPSGMRYKEEADVGGGFKKNSSGTGTGTNSSPGKSSGTQNKNNTPSTSTPKYSSSREEYNAQRRAATTPSMDEYMQLQRAGYRMSYQEYARYKAQTQFPSYDQYMYEKSIGRSTFNVNGPLQEITGQNRTYYPKTGSYPSSPRVLSPEEEAACNMSDVKQSWLQKNFDRFLSWAKSDKGKETLLTVVSVVEIVGGIALIATGGASPIGTALLAGGMSSLLGGHFNKMQGKSFTSGWAGGQVSGLITGYGGGVVSNILKKALAPGSAALVEFAKAGKWAFSSATIGGSVGSIISDVIDGNPIDLKKAAKNGLINGTIAGLASMVAGVPVAISEEFKGAGAAISGVLESVFDTFSTAMTSGK